MPGLVTVEHGETNCIVNWHKKQLKLWVVQSAGGEQPWLKEIEKAAENFFSQSLKQIKC